MKTCFSSIRILISFFLGILLVAVITVGIPLASISKVLTNSQNLKTWLDEGGVYEKAAEIIFEMTTSKAQEEFSEEVNLEEEDDILASVEDLMPPDWIKYNAENVIDSLYTWLEGDTEYPEFEIDLSDRRVLIIDEITKNITNQIESLPACSDEELGAMEGQDLNPLELTCLPPDFDTDEINERMEEELEKQDFLQEDKISSKDFFEGSTEAKEGLESINKIVRLNYPIIKKLDIYVFAIIIILSIVLFVTIPGLANSFLFTGISWVTAGVTLVFGNAFGRSSLLTYLEEELKKAGNDLVDVFRRPMELASSDIQSQITQYATVIIVLGVVFTIGGIILKFSKKRYYIEDEGSSKSDKQPEVRLK